MSHQYPKASTQALMSSVNKKYLDLKTSLAHGAVGGVIGGTLGNLGAEGLESLIFDTPYSLDASNLAVFGGTVLAGAVIGAAYCGYNHLIKAIAHDFYIGEENKGRW